MKISYYGKFKRLWDEEYIARSFEALGHTVDRIEQTDGESTDQIIERVKKYKPDFFMCAKLEMDTPRHFLAAMKKAHIPTISWTFDLLLGHPPRERVIRQYDFLKCDYVFMTDGGHDKEYADLGVNKITLRQGIPEEYAYMGEYDEKYDHDVVFVGTMNPTFPYRQKCLDTLSAIYGDRFKWYGRASSEDIRGHELNKLYASAKVVVGDSMFGDYYWSNRVYETLGRGGMLIMPKIKGLDEEYEPFKHYMPYHWGNFKELKVKIDHLIKHPKVRENYKRDAFMHTSLHYKATDRVRQIITTYEDSIRRQAK